MSSALKPSPNAEPAAPGVRAFASLRDLEVLRALILARKTTAAASQLGVSQPAVSRAIALLEQRSGRALFRRDGGRLIPTADALALYEETTPVFEALGRLDRFDWRPKRAAPLRVFAPPTIAHHYLQRVLAAFLAASGDRAVTLEITTSPDVFAAVADRRADLGVSDAPVAHPALLVEPFRRSEAVCAMPKGHRLAARAVVTPSDLDGEPFVAFARRLWIRATLDRLFAEAGARPLIRVETATVVSAMELVRAGAGLSLFNPFPAASPKDLDLVFRPFAPAVAYETAFVFPADGPPSPLARELADFARAAATADRFSTPLP